MYIINGSTAPPCLITLKRLNKRTAGIHKGCLSIGTVGFLGELICAMRITCKSIKAEAQICDIANYKLN